GGDPAGAARAGDLSGVWRDADGRVGPPDAGGAGVAAGDRPGGRPRGDRAGPSALREAPPADAGPGRGGAGPAAGEPGDRGAGGVVAHGAAPAPRPDSDVSGDGARAAVEPRRTGGATAAGRPARATGGRGPAG